MTCAEIQAALSRSLDGEDVAVPRPHLERCPDCLRFEELSAGIAGDYRGAVLASHEALRKLARPRARRRPWLAFAAALLLACFTSRVAPPPPPAEPPIAIEIPDLPASLRSEGDIDLLALARDLPVRLGDAWPAEDVMPRSVAE
jgi:hypothetical protein